MHDRIHADEKWFYLKEGKLNAILAFDEDMPYGNVQSKRFLTKVMFMCAVARPRFDANRKVRFDGKIGLWMFTEEVQASTKKPVAEKILDCWLPISILSDISVPPQFVVNYGIQPSHILHLLIYRNSPSTDSRMLHPRTRTNRLVEEVS